MTQAEILAKRDELAYAYAIDKDKSEPCTTVQRDLYNAYCSGADAAIQLMLSREQVLRDALVKLDKHWWFDKFDKKNESLACPACMFCDMGEAGAKINRDGHDLSCDVSMAHEALAEVEEWK